MIGKLQGDRALLLGAVGIFSLAMISSGYLLGDGLRRAKSAERSVSVRGVSERDVTADLATWSLSFSRTGADLPSVNAAAEAQSAAVRRFFVRAGFKPSDISDTGVSVSRTTLRDNDGHATGEQVAVNRSMQLRTRDVMRARATHERLAELITAGVELDSENLGYNFTRLNDLKPAMIAEATKRARESAEQFAHDSGARVGSIRNASQGYFSVGPRDGAGDSESSGSGSPLQKVRVVTNVDYDIDAG